MKAKTSPESTAGPVATRRPGRPGRPSGAAAGAGQRARLLDVALALFARHGIVDTTLGAIAREAGVTPAMLHYYFHTRDQLLDVLIDERFVPLRASLRGVFDAHPDEPVAALTDLALRFVRLADEHPWFPPLWIREVISEGGLLRQRMRERFGDDEPRATLANIARWQREGKLNPALDPSLVFVSLLGLTVLPLATSRVWRDDPARQRIGAHEVARHAVAMIAYGVSPPPSGDTRGAGAQRTAGRGA